MNSVDIILSNHASMQMQRRRVTLEDIILALRFGEHVDGHEPDTMEACIELDGKPLTVVYNAIENRLRNSYHIITVIRRMCSE